MSPKKKAFELPEHAIGNYPAGSVVELLVVTPTGGTMQGRMLAAGTKLRIDWLSPRAEPEHAFATAWDEFDERFEVGGPTDVIAATTPVRLIEEYKPKMLGDAGEVVDPLAAAREHGKLFER